jgi:hypothetical protein
MINLDSFATKMHFCVVISFNHKMSRPTDKPAIFSVEIIQNVACDTSIKAFFKIERNVCLSAGYGHGFCLNFVPRILVS